MTAIEAMYFGIPEDAVGKVNVVALTGRCVHCMGKECEQCLYGRATPRQGKLMPAKRNPYYANKRRQATIQTPSANPPRFA